MTLHDDGRSSIVVERDEAPLVLVAFAGIAGGLAMPPKEFFGVTSGLPVQRVFVRDPTSAFYQRGLADHCASLDGLGPALAAVIGTQRPTVLIGNSAGATAALAAAHSFPSSVTLAFAPVTIFGRFGRALVRDSRWKQEMAQLRRGRMHVADLASHLREHPPGVSDVYFGARNRLDAIHAARLASVPDVHLHDVDSESHGFVRELRDAGLLRTIIERAVDRVAGGRVE